MNNLTITKTHEYYHLPKQSMYSDGRVLTWDGKNTIFSWLKDIFVELYSKSWEEIYDKNTLFQFLLNEYLFEQHIETFLEDNWFLLENIFYNFEDFKYYLSIKNDVFLDIKSWRINLAILFNWLTPIWIVLAKKLDIDEKIIQNIELLRQDFVNRIWKIPELRDFTL